VTLSCQRELFSLPPSLHYLNCAYMGPLPRSVEAAGVEGVRRKGNPRLIQARDFFEPVDALRGLVGRLVNAPESAVAFIPSVSYGMGLAAHNLPLERGQNVVLCAEEFPSNVYTWREVCAAAGAELRLVPRPEGTARPSEAWTEAVLAAIDTGSAVVSPTIAHWTDGTLLDVEAVARRTRALGAGLVVDGTQSVGAVPFDFRALQPDLLLCAGYKWCLGPYNYGFAVLGERLLAGRPLEAAWTHREGCEDFSRLVNYTDRLRSGGRRFDVGEQANFVAVPMLHAALEQILTWGVENIQGYCTRLVTELAADLADSEFQVAGEGQRGGHLCGIRIVDEDDVPRIVEELQRRNVVVAVRGTAIRVSPHVYNDGDDIAALSEALLAARR